MSDAFYKNINIAVKILANDVTRCTKCAPNEL